jgi:hypothetical protein
MQVLKSRQGLVLTPRGLNSSTTTPEKQNLQEKKLKYTYEVLYIERQSCVHTD